jgi:hypothetical protein
MKTVWIYVDTDKEVGGVDHLKVFATPELADGWFKENDPEAACSATRRSKNGRGRRFGTIANRNRVFHGTSAGTGFKGNI